LGVQVARLRVPKGSHCYYVILIPPQHEDRLIKMTWNPEKGTADIDMNAALSFKNMATKLDFWVPLGLQYGVAAEGALPSNTAIYWNGADKITLFTSEEYSSQKLQGNSLSADIVTVSATPLCKQYLMLQTAIQRAPHCIR